MLGLERFLNVHKCHQIHYKDFSHLTHTHKHTHTHAPIHTRMQNKTHGTHFLKPLNTRIIQMEQES